jgi:chromosome segregation ATPase
MPIQNDMKQIESAMKSFNLQIEGYQKQIEEETRRLEADTQAKREESQRNLNAARSAVDEAQDNVSQIANEMRALFEKTDNLRREGEAKESEVTQLRKKIQDCDQFIARVAQLNNNNLAAYGNDINRLLAEIHKMKWHGDVPLGPLGLHVKVREPEKWADLLRSQLRNLLTAFAVTDSRDRKALSNLLQRSNK